MVGDARSKTTSDVERLPHVWGSHAGGIEPVDEESVMLKKSHARDGESTRSESRGADTPARQVRIEDLPQFGPVPAEEDLRLVNGGLRSASYGTCCEPGMCDDD
jgi:hypothetical protein